MKTIKYTKANYLDRWIDDRGSAINGQWISIIGLALLCLGALWLTSGCGESGGTAAVPPATPLPGPYVPPIDHCTNGVCPGGGGQGGGFLGAVLGQSVSYSMGNTVEMEIALELYGGGVAGTGVPYNTTISGNGVVSARGQLTMAIPSVLCGVPVGVYTLTTVQPGQLTNNGESILRLGMTGVGPTQIRVMLANTFVDDAIPPARSLNGRNFPYRLQGEMYLQGAANPYSQACPIVIR